MSWKTAGDAHIWWATTTQQGHRNVNRRLTEICDPTRMSKSVRDPLYPPPLSRRDHRACGVAVFPLSVQLGGPRHHFSHQTVRAWAEKFGRHCANEIKRRSAGPLGVTYSDLTQIGCRLDGHCAPMSLAGSVANFRFGYRNSGNGQASRGGDDFELLGDGRIWIEGVPRLSLAHHVDHLDPAQRGKRACE